MEDKEFLQCLCNTGVKLNEDGKTVEELKLMVIKRELGFVEGEDRELLYNALPEHAQIKFDQGKVTMKNIVHWLLPDLIFRTYVKEENRDRDIEGLREWADKGK